MPGHQLLRLGAQRLRLLGVSRRLRLGEQRADAGEGTGLRPGRATRGTRLLQRLQHGQSQQQAVQLQYGRGVRETVGAGQRPVRYGVELGGPARSARAVVRRLGTDQRGHQPYVHVVQFAPHDPHQVGRLPAAPPGRGHELLAAREEVRVRRGVGREQRGGRVEGVVGGVVQGGLEGAVDGAGRTHPAMVPRPTHRKTTVNLRLTAPGVQPTVDT